jgi:hypothetical protein
MVLSFKGIHFEMVRTSGQELSPASTALFLKREPGLPLR